MNEKAACLICKHASAEPFCPCCGVDSDKLLEMIKQWPRPELNFDPHVSQHKIREQSEQVWALLAPDFQQQVLQDYRTLLELRNRAVNGTLSAVSLVCHAAGFLAGMWFLNSVLAWRVGAMAQMTFAGVVACLLSMFVGGMLEYRLLRTQAAKTLRDFERSFRLINLALISRVKMPFYQQNEFLYPFAAVCGVVIGMAL